MNVKTNQYGQLVGESLKNWKPRALPSNVILEGLYCRLEPLKTENHAKDLFAAYSLMTDSRDWTYMLAEPFNSLERYESYVDSISSSNDPKHWAVIDKHTGKAVGTLSLMRIDPNNGVIEVGHVMFSPLLKQKPASTDAQFLLMQYVFNDLKYRRYEWKCDSLNGPSRKAAGRLGFKFEGIFRQSVVYKNRTRDTAWYSVIDTEWPQLENTFRQWLDSTNFDAKGRQIKSLEKIRKKMELTEKFKNWSFFR